MFFSVQILKEYKVITTGPPPTSSGGALIMVVSLFTEYLSLPVKRLVGN